jgi:hypothetical protein
MSFASFPTIGPSVSQISRSGWYLAEAPEAATPDFHASATTTVPAAPALARMVSPVCFCVSIFGSGAGYAGC